MMGSGLEGAARAIGDLLLQKNTAYGLQRSDPVSGSTNLPPPREHEKALRGLGKYANGPVWEGTLDALSRELRGGSVEDPHKQTPLVNKAIVIAQRPLLVKGLATFNKKVDECRAI